MPKQEDSIMSVDQFFDLLKVEAISKKGSKMEGGYTLKFAKPFGVEDLSNIPVFKSDEDLNNHITNNLSNHIYVVYGIKDGKIKKAV